MAMLVLAVPGRPGQPVPEDWDVDYVDLTWTSPKDDGGSPITGYIVERKTKFR